MQVVSSPELTMHTLSADAELFNRLHEALYSTPVGHYNPYYTFKFLSFYRIYLKSPYFPIPRDHCQLL